jgi:ABC-2 type transport system permease protein
MSLLRAGSFLVLASAKNRVRRMLSKLREPRYLVGAAAMALYLWSLLSRSLVQSRRPDATVVFQQWSGLAQLLTVFAVAAGAALSILATWTLGPDRLAFSFTEAEVTWLLSGPVTRRGILRYKVAVGLLRTLLSALIVTLLFRRGVSARPGFLALATWLAFALLWLHAAGASLVRIGWQRSGKSVRRRTLVGAVLLGGLALAVGAALPVAGPLPAWEAASPGALGATVGAWLEALAGAPSLAWALVPARAFVGIALAQNSGEAFYSLGVLVLLALALLGWVLLLDVPFEEAALASAERRARLVARRQRRGLPLPRLTRVPHLRSKGAPEWALAWKNWVALRRVYGARLGVLLIPMALGIGFAVWGGLQRRGGGSDWRLLGSLVAAGFAVLTVFFGPMGFRTDLRSDLRRLDVLRTLPLSGAQVVRGELLAPAVLLGVTEVTLLVLALGLSAGTGPAALSFNSRVAWTAGAFLLLPAATAAVLVVQNAAALVFPALLVDDEEHAPRGVEAAGTRLLNLGATLLLLLVGFLPGGVLGGVVAALAFRVGLGPLASTAGCAAAAAVLVGEVLLAVRWMGRGLERLDPSTA